MSVRRRRSAGCCCPPSTGCCGEFQRLCLGVSNINQFPQSASFELAHTANYTQFGCACASRYTQQLTLSVSFTGNLVINPQDIVIPYGNCFANGVPISIPPAAWRGSASFQYTGISCEYVDDYQTEPPYECIGSSICRCVTRTGSGQFDAYISCGGCVQNPCSPNAIRVGWAFYAVDLGGNPNASGGYFDREDFYGVCCDLQQQKGLSCSVTGPFTAIDRVVCSALFNAPGCSQNAPCSACNPDQTFGSFGGPGWSAQLGNYDYSKACQYSDVTSTTANVQFN